jgi:hypothetical protein
MYEINNQVQINAPIAQVWRVLTDFDRFHEWNPVIRRIEGDLAVGRQVVMTVNTPHGERQWALRISRLDTGRELGWRFRERHPLLYRGEHTFWLAAIDEHTTRYIDRETFHGLLVPRRRHALGTQTKSGMVAMGDALKRRAEQPAD